MAEGEDAGLNAVLSGRSSAERERISAQIEADQQAGAETDPEERGGVYRTDPLDDDPGRSSRRHSERYANHGGEAQITRVVFRTPMLVLYAFEAYWRRRLRLEKALEEAGVQLDEPFGERDYEARVAAMVEDVFGRAIVEDMDRPPDRRLFDWRDAVVPGLDLFIEQLVGERFALRRAVLDQAMAARVRERFRSATEEDVNFIVGEVAGRGPNVRS